MTEMMTNELKKCSRCASEIQLKYFKINRKGTYNKTCLSCADKRKKSVNKNKCEHNRIKSQCKECGGVRICEHNRHKSSCKDCGGSQFCEHNRIKSTCKECGGISICEHNRIKSRCKDCGGSQICEHNRRKSTCKDCGGSQICEHNREKSQCKECGGISICEHNRRKSQCKECGGGSICEHNRIKSRCKECGGSQICEHNREKSQCKECNPISHLAHTVRSSVNSALKTKKSKKSIEYLGCSIVDFKKHIEVQFQEGMTWENHGEWHIDHIIPLKYENPTLEETIERLHWKNTQPLWATDNIAKGNRFIG